MGCDDAYHAYGDNDRETQSAGGNMSKIEECDPAVQEMAEHALAKAIGGTSRSGDMYKPHTYMPTGLPGLIGAPCLMCGGDAANPLHSNVNEPEPLPYGKLRIQAVGEPDSTKRIVHVEIRVDNPPTREAERILMDTLPKVLEKFLAKNADYGDGDEMRCLGARAEFVRLWNKAAKLKRAIWDGEPLTGEQPDEIMGDMIGHLLLALNRSKE